MKYFGKSISYMFKNSLLFFCLTIVPACVLGGLLRPFLLTNFLLDYKGVVVNNYVDVISNIFNVSWYTVVFSFVAVLIITMFLCVIFGNIESHFRTGKHNYNDTRSYINNNLSICFVFIMLIVLIYLLFVFVNSILIFLIHLTFTGLGNLPNTLTMALTWLVSIVLVITFVCFAMTLFLCIPETISTGYSVRTSIANVADYTNKKMFKMFVAFFMPLIITFLIILLTRNLYLFGLISIILAILLISYYCILNYVIYFDLTNQDRVDVSSKFNFKFFKR